MNIYQKELYHHGVMGMHWGVRRYQPYPKGYRGDGKFVGTLSNKQQKKFAKRVARRASRTTALNRNVVLAALRYRYGLKPTDWEKPSKDAVRTKEAQNATSRRQGDINNAITKRDKAMKDSRDIHSGYFRNEALLDRYLKEKVKLDMLPYYDKNKHGSQKEYLEEWFKTYKNTADLDQGNITSFDLYLKDNPKIKRRYDDAKKRLRESTLEIHTIAQEVADDLVGNYGDLPVTSDRVTINGEPTKVSVKSFLSDALTDYYEGRLS